MSAELSQLVAENGQFGIAMKKPYLLTRRSFILIVHDVLWGMIMGDFQRQIPAPYTHEEGYRPEDQRSERKKSGPIIKIISVVGVVTMLALVMIFIGATWKDPRSTPEGTMREYVSAFNAYDARWLIDCSVMAFYSSSDYFRALDLLQPFYDDMRVSHAHKSLTINSVMYSSQMSQTEMILVNASIQNNVIGYGIQVIIQDSCLVSSISTTTGVGLFTKNNTFTNTLLQVNGLWYISWAV